MICPKCGFEQPESPECVRCGIIVSRYRGPVFGGAPASAAAPEPPPLPPQLPPPLPPPIHQTVDTATLFGDPAPAAAAAVAGSGTLYAGPTPAMAGGGTAYSESGPWAPAAPVPLQAVGVIRRLSIGEVLSESFSVYFKNLIPFTILTALAFAPVFLLAGFLEQGVAANSPLAAGSALLGVVLTLLVSIPIATAAINYGVFQQMLGRDTSLADCLRVGLSCLLPVLSVVFLQIVVVIAVFIASVIPVAFLIGGAVAATSSGDSSAGAGCGLLLIPLIFLCYVPPIMVWLKYFVAVPAAVEERPGPVNALRRSSFLTKGQRWPIFGTVFVLIVLTLGAILVAALIPVAGVVLGPLAELIMCGIFSTTCAVVYYRLRSFKESIDVGQISSVFA